MPIKDAISGVVDSAKEFFSSDERDGDTSTVGTADAKPVSGDALDVLKADHRRAKALFQTILAEKSLALTGQRENVATVIAELTLHAKIEESILYPAVYAKTKRDTDDRLDVLEAVEEHGAMKDLIKKIKRSSGRDETLKAKVQVLSEITEHHVEEEESTFFPEARKLLGEKRLKDLGVEIQKIKARANRPSSERKPKAAKTTPSARKKSPAPRAK